MLPHSAEKVKDWFRQNRTDLLTALIIFLISMASFGLGRLSVSLPQKESIHIEDPVSFEAQGADLSKDNSFVASKSGSVYYAVWCSGVSRIREENKVWFRTKEDAKAQGYRPAKNCPGM